MIYVQICIECVCSRILHILGDLHVLVWSRNNKKEKNLRAHETKTKTINIEIVCRFTIMRDERVQAPPSGRSKSQFTLDWLDGWRWPIENLERLTDKLYSICIYISMGWYSLLTVHSWLMCMCAFFSIFSQSLLD